MSEKKKLIIEISIFVLFLIGITVIYNYIINKDAETSVKESSIKSIKDEETIEIMEIKNPEQFEQEVINESGTVFIDFYATWCMPCKTMSPIIQEIAKEYKEVKFVIIDVDKNEKLAIKYNIMSIPTMMVMKNGEITKTFVGVTNKESIIREF